MTGKYHYKVSYIDKFWLIVLVDDGEVIHDILIEVYSTENDAQKVADRMNSVI